MKKLIAPILIVALVLFCLTLIDRACGLSDKLKLAKHDYTEREKITEADKQISDARIAELNNAIGQADKTIVNLEKVIAQKNKDITTLNGQLAEIVGQEPPTTPEIEAMPIVVSLRAQVSKLTEMYSLSQQTITLQSQEIDVLRGKCVSLESIGAEWKGQYEREHALRLTSEGLVTSLEKRVRLSGLWGTTKTVLIGAAVGYIGYTLLKK